MTDFVLPSPTIRTCVVSSFPQGIALSAARGGERVLVAGRMLLTSDDGPLVYAALDSFSHMDDFAPLFAGLRLEDISTLLINVDASKRARAWINPIATSMNCVSTTNLEKGQNVLIDDLAHISDVTFEGMEEPPTDGAIIYVCRVGWRFGVFFDFTMFPHEPTRPVLSIGSVAGAVHNALVLRNRMAFDDTTLALMYEKGWFPFIGLPTTLSRDVANAVTNGWPLDDIEKRIVASVSMRIPKMVDTWKQKPAFANATRRLSEAARLLPRVSTRRLTRSRHLTWKAYFDTCTLGVIQGSLTTSD